VDLSVIKFDSNGLVPAIAQDYENGEVLMLAYMNTEALQKTISTGKAHYYSRSRSKLWLKGETSGHVQLIKEIRYDCDADAILIKVDQKVGACHTGHRSCFYRTIDGEESKDQVFDPDMVYKNGETTPYILNKVFKVIRKRMDDPKEGSYVNSLIKKGEEHVLRKVGEEALEVILASKDGRKDRIIEEAADLVFHLLILLGTNDVEPDDVYSELHKRHRPD